MAYPKGRRQVSRMQRPSNVTTFPVDPDEVRKVFSYCCAKVEENFHVESAVYAKGALCIFRFDRSRLEERRFQVAKLLSALPEQFHTEEGGNWTSICIPPQPGRLRRMIYCLQVDQLLALGTALGLVTHQVPHTRGTWRVL